MKKSHIIGLIVIAIGIAVIISTAGNASSYVTFQQAKSIDKEVHVVGVLTKDQQGTITGINVSPDKTSFSFNLIDDNNDVQKVIYQEPMPQDFTKSEKVVVIGQYHGDDFVASKILMKCPSKYNDNKLRDVKGKEVETAQL